MYLNLTFMNLYCRTGILIVMGKLSASINSARYTERIIQTVKSRLTADCPPMSIVSEKGVAMDTEPYPVVAGLLIRKAVTW